MYGTSFGEKVQRSAAGAVVNADSCTYETNAYIQTSVSHNNRNNSNNNRNNSNNNNNKNNNINTSSNK